MFPLRVRSHYSLLHGTASPEELCKVAKVYGYKGLAITDRDNLYGLPAFIKACNKTGLKPIVGAEITDPQDAQHSVTCLVKNQQGYSNLCALISARHIDKSFSLDAISPGQTEGIIFLFSKLTLLKKYLCQNMHIVGDLKDQPTSKGQEIRDWAIENKVPAICTPNSSLADGNDQDLYILLQAISQNSSISRLQNSTEETCALLPPATYKDRFAIWPEVIAQTNCIAKVCEFTGPNFGIIMPPWQVNKQEIPATVLRDKAYRGARNRYGDDLSEAVVERLEYELRTIEEMGFSSYFLVVRDIVHRKGEDGIRRKRRICGRGSGAASLVAYCLEITNVCPIRHNLYFERFLNPGRSDPPDIDIDFAWDERDKVLEEVLAIHKNHVAMVCNHVFFQPRMAIRETAKAFGLPGYEISQLTKRLPWFYQHDGESLETRISRSPSLKDQSLAKPWPEILALAERLVGTPRYLSVHPGGVVITPDPIKSYVPIEIASKGVPIIQWEKDGAEEAGLVKIDILGNRSLGVIRDSIANVRDNGISFREDTWCPEDDKPTKISISKGITMGCFYIESPAMRLLQRKAHSGEFEQLVLQSSIIRPAANEFVREYVRRLHGGKWQHLHPDLEDVLDETFGLMVYQEDVSKVAVALAGFSHARADGLRKVLSKKDRELRLHDYKEEFYTGCSNREIDHDTIDKLWAMMMSFDGYSFCKPHSASYAKVSYQAAYLKTHHPAEFMAAVISNQGGFYSCFGYVSEAKRIGLTILPPDVNKSVYRWQGKGNALLVGFLSIHNLSHDTGKKIVHARETTPYKNVADFLHRVRPAEDEARSLIHAGALDNLQLNSSRTRLLWDLACFKQVVSSQKKISLFTPSLPDPPNLPEQPKIQRLRYEYQVLGFLCKTHPISMFSKITSSMVKGKDISLHVNKTITFAGWLLTGKIVSTKTGEAMEFLTFEDETATVESTFFPKVYKKYAHMLKSGRGYILTGLVEEDFGATTLTVHSLQPLGNQKR